MFILGLRKVYPYYFTFTTFTKVINEKLKTNEITFLSLGQKKNNTVRIIKTINYNALCASKRVRKLRNSCVCVQRDR